MNRELRDTVENWRAKNYTMDSNGLSDEDSDAYRLADAYVAEHPADDGEAVTKEWMDGVLPEEHRPLDWSKENWLIVFPGTRGDLLIPRDTTRGEFRALCRGLRIPLKS